MSGRAATDAAVDDRDGAAPRLSVVLITENEADRIETCLDSVFAACRRAVPSFEVILVDSASTDETVERASDYPITIERIPAEHTVSCGAGRYVGDAAARGDLTLHVDGDMELTEEWLARAAAYLRDHDDVAAVEGCLDESDQDGVVDVDKVGGCMLYDAAALESVGGFDPWLVGYEDVDAGYRLSTAGYRLVRLPDVSAVHPTGDGLSEPLRRWRMGYYFASGQTMRKSLDSPRMLAKLLARQRYKAGLFGWLLLGLAVLPRRRALAGWVGGSLVAFAALAALRGPAGAARFTVRKCLGLAGVPVGLAKEARDPETFPLEAVERVRTGPIHGRQRAAESG